MYARENEAIIVACLYPAGGLQRGSAVLEGINCTTLILLKDK